MVDLQSIRKKKSTHPPIHIISIVGFSKCFRGQNYDNRSDMSYHIYIDIFMGRNKPT